MSVNIGKLNKRITFLKKVKETDEIGQDKFSFVDFKTVWATVTPYKSNDTSLKGKKSPSATDKIYIRYREDIDDDMQIRYKNRLYKMVGYPVDMDEKHELLEIQVEVV